MRRKMVLAAVAAWAIAAQAFALTPSDLMPAMTGEENSFYATLKDPAAAQGFLATRAYVRKARAVVDGAMPAADFPAKKPEGFSVEYLLPDDPSVINNALGQYLSATLTAHPELLQSH